MAADSGTKSAQPLLEVNDLVKHFPVRDKGTHKVVHAVDGVSLTLRAGETLGVVGESGCGKSTVARLLVGLLEPTSGSVRVNGGDIWARGAEGAARRRSLQMVFQNPAGSMDPRRTVGAAIAEPLRARGIKATGDRVAEILTLCGGQHPLTCIARALIAEPALVVHDESVASLDISLQAQILNLLVELQDRLGVAYLFISHDLAAVQAISHRVAVMYLGEVVETASADQFAKQLLHPYSVALRGAALVPDPEIEQRRTDIVLSGDVPSPMDPPTGCRFRTRCPLAEKLCEDEKPALAAAGDGRLVACHFPGRAFPNERGDG
jgi:oligopeptide transport system ATP-binding protein